MTFGEALDDVRRFLDENRREVVTLIIQDAITPADTARAFGEAGLDDRVHRHRSGRPWATLGELIERDERLVVFAEDVGPPPSWYNGLRGDAGDAVPVPRGPSSSPASPTGAGPTPPSS